jgi:hypothetical protein
VLRCRPLSGILVAAAVLLPQRHAVAQGTILERARKAMQGAANAGKKAATDEVNRQVNSAVLDAAAEDVADGSFVAVLSPWSTDNKASVEAARYAGNAFVVSTAAGRQVIICDPKGVLPWQTTFTISNAAVGTPTNKALGSGKSSTATAASGRGGAAPSGRGAGAATTGTARGGSAPSTAATSGAKGDSSNGGGSGGAKAAPAPSAGEKEYKVPSPQIAIAFPISGPKTGAATTGSIIVANVSQEVLGGAVKVRFAQATIPGEKGPQVVDFGVAFKAMVLAAGTAPSGCLAPAAAKGATTAARGGAAPATTPGNAAARGATVRGAAPPPAATTPNATGTTTPPAITFAEGDVLIPKIDNVKLLAAANDSAKVTVALKITDEVVYLGDEKDGYLHVQGSNGEGWIRKALLKKK